MVKYCLSSNGQRKESKMLFEKLSDVIAHIKDELYVEEIVLVEDFVVRYCFGGIAYHQTSKEHFEIETIKGKKTKKWYHIIICRLDSGRYELVSYAS
jgi:hypothetical protein